MKNFKIRNSKMGNRFEMGGGVFSICQREAIEKVKPVSI